MRAVPLVTLFALTLSGCSGIPFVPYEEPAQSEKLARLRVITNADIFGDSITGNCAPATRHRMVAAGRFSASGAANRNYPQFPEQTATIGMPARAASALIDYIPSVRMGEGVYKEVVTEYRVRADLPFQIATLGATIGTYGMSYGTCPSQARVFKLEPGKDYEAVVGVSTMQKGDGSQGGACILKVSELRPMAKGAFIFPMPVESSAPAQESCKY